MNKLKITCFGEVLWDIFPSHRKIGGAPLNVANRLKSFGNEVSIISSVGNDELSESIREFLNDKGINTAHIQSNSELSTGAVNVVLDSKGSATYDILFPKAWDAIDFKLEDKNLVSASDAFIFGSLIARNECSKNTLLEFLKLDTFKVFDVNLRAPYYSYEVLLELLNRANFVKFNDDELLEISQYLGATSTTIEDNIHLVIDKTNVSHVCVTRGEHGAVLFFDGKFYENKGFTIDVVDTVGAGDSFLATLINILLKENSPQKAIDVACAVGALVASMEGANPVVKDTEVKDLMTNQ